MGFFASWWERVPVKQVASTIVLLALVSAIGVEFGGLKPIGSRVHVYFKPTGEVWG
jgi:hypothetical protein